MTNDLATVTRIATTAGTHLRDFARDTIDPRAKTATSFVTEADESTERQIRDAIHEHFPGDAILGEEFGLDGDPAATWWAVDPLDGTSNYIAGIPIYCVAIARFEGGRPTLAVIHDPERGDTYTAERGHGAARNGEPLAVDDRALGPLTMVTVRHGVVRRAPEWLAKLRPVKLRSFGSVCLELAWIAEGRLHGAYGRQVHLWDVAAGGLLIEEAGGCVETTDGPLFPLREPAGYYASHELPVIAGAPGVVDRLRDALR